MAINFNNFFNNFLPLPVSQLIIGTTTVKGRQSAQNPSSIIPSSTMVPTSTIFAQPGYMTNNFESLFQASARQQKVKQTNLLDFSVLETDKNFSKVPVQNQLNTSISQLGMATQLLSMIQTQFKILGVKEYNPTSVSNSVYNSQSLNSSNTNFLPVFQQGVTEKSFASSLTTDLNTLYADKNILLADFVLISKIISTSFPSLASITNNPIQNILGIPLSSYLPTSIVAIAASPLLIDSLTNAGLTSPQQATFNNNLTNFLTAQSAQPVSTLVTAPNYQNISITMADPLGISAATQMISEIQTNFNNNLNTFLTSQNITDPTIVSLLQNDFKDNVNSGIDQLLPKMTSVVNGVIVATTNSLGSALTLAVNSVLLNIMSDLGVISPSGTKLAPMDLLQNLHRNIQDRQDIINQGGTIDQVSNLDTELLPYFVAGTYNVQTLAALTANLEKFVNG